MNAPQLQPPQKCGFSTIHHKHVLGQLIQPQLHETNPRIQNRKCCHGHKQKKDTTPQQPLHRPRLRRWPDRKGVSEPSSSFRIGKYDENPWGPDESLPNMYRVFDKYLCCSYLSNFYFTGSCPIWWKKRYDTFQFRMQMQTLIHHLRWTIPHYNTTCCENFSEFLGFFYL